MNTETRVIAIDPTSHGFGYVIFEGRHNLIDWGHTTIKPNDNNICMELIAGILARYQPEVVVLEDWTSLSSKRRKRIKLLLAEVTDFVLSADSEVEVYSPKEVQTFFSSIDKKLSKHDIASSIAATFPELISKLPRKRKIWQSEDERMSIFDSAALALTYFHHLRIQDIEI